jgi:hypothetical protein
MLGVYEKLKSFFTYRGNTTSGLVFKMHYRATVCIILIFCLMVSTRQYVGDPIKCIHNKDLPQEVINTFCWIHSTFSVKSAFGKKVGIDISHPGIANSLGGQQPRQEYRYYQWVVFVLLLQVSDRFTFTFLWPVTTCSIIDGCKRTYVQAVGSPETPVLNFRARCHISDHPIGTPCRGNLKFHEKKHFTSQQVWTGHLRLFIDVLLDCRV